MKKNLHAKKLRLLCLVLTVVMLASTLLACGDTTDASEPSVSFKEGFVLTRPMRPTDAEQDATLAIYEACQAVGINITAQDDLVIEGTETPKNEILIGKTARTESQNALDGLGSRDYTIRLVGSEEGGYKIVIAASGDEGIAAAAEYFIKTYLSGENAGLIARDTKYDYVFSYACENVQIAGRPISDYKIVYAKEGVTSPTDPHYNTFIQTAKYKDTAEALADMIEYASGLRPEVLPDSESIAEGTPTILFGKTELSGDDFAYTSSFSETGSYTGKLLDDGTVVLAGDNACAVYAAGEALIAALTEAKTDLTAFDVKGAKDLIKVACIGDSITHGTSSSDESAYNYPVYLQRMLGYDYYVEKYGAPGYSLTTSDTYQYMSYSIFNSSLEAEPDVVIIMLGTNDCNPHDDYKDWTSVRRSSNFTKSAETMIAAYREANKDAQIYLMTPPTVPQNEAWANNVRDYAVPLITKAAKNENCQLIDIYEWSLTHTSTFTADGGDGLHPKNEHYGELAQAVYDGLKDSIVKPE